MPYVPFPLDEIALKAPVPVNVWDPNGVLLLRKGEVIEDEKHRDRLHMHLPMVDEAEYRAWTYRYHAALDRMVRGNESLETIAGMTRPMGLESSLAQVDDSPLEAWPDLHDTLATLLHQGEAANDFLNRLDAIEKRMAAVLRSKVDDSLFVLVQMLYDRTVSYSATHALLCAVLVRLVGKTYGLDEVQRTAVQRAALTMNIGMSRLHDALSRQADPLQPPQREQVRTHPARSVALLQKLGVRDASWLYAVRDHHEVVTGSGYPAGRQDPGVLAQLLRLADVFVARLSSRAHRPGLPAHRAARDIYLGHDGQPTTMGAAFVKTLGAYIPGSYVRLSSGELGVVVRRGRRANTPMVFALVGRQGLPLGEPALRDTAETAYEVKGGIPATDVKVRVSPARLLSRL